MKLEDGSYTVQDTVYMSTERVQTFANFYHTDENGNQFILEDGGVILDERRERRVINFICSNRNYNR